MALCMFDKVKDMLTKHCLIFTRLHHPISKTKVKLHIYFNSLVNVVLSEIYLSLCTVMQPLSFIKVAMNSRDRYEIIGLCKISYFKNNLVEVFV